MKVHKEYFLLETSIKVELRNWVGAHVKMLNHTLQVSAVI